MTYEEAREEAEEIINDYRDNNSAAPFPFPYGLDYIYDVLPESALSDVPEEVEVVIKVFAEHIMIYHTPLAKAMREEDDSQV